jgi:hypothetical protein
MFELLMSLWTIPRSCAASSASPAWMAISKAYSSLRGRCWIFFCKVENLAVPLVDLVDRADVGVVERRCGLGLAEKPLAQAGIRHRLGGQEFQRHRPLQPSILGAVHDAHGALAELLNDPIARDGLASHSPAPDGLSPRRSQMPAASR